MKITCGPDDSTKAFQRKIKQFERTGLTALLVAERAAGKLIVNTVRKTMESNIPPANNPVYLEYKEKHGWELKTLLRTRLLQLSVRSQRIFVTANTILGFVGWDAGMRYGGILHQGVYGRGVPKSRKGSVGSGVSGYHETTFHGRKAHERMDTKSLSEVARLMEEGGKHNPSRQFLLMAAEKALPGVAQIFADAMARSMPIPPQGWMSRPHGGNLEEAPF